MFIQMSSVQAGQSVHITSMSETLLLNLCPSVFSPFISIHCVFKLAEPIKKKSPIVAKRGYWIEEIITQKKTVCTFFNNFCSLPNSLSLQTIWTL